MNNYHEKKSQMYLTVEAYCKQNAAITELLPNFSLLVNSLSEKNSVLNALTEKHQLDQSGTAVNVGQLKEKLVNLAIDASRKLTAYASYKKDLVLLSEVQLSKTGLKSSPAQKLVDLATGLYNRAQLHMEELQTYNVTDASQTALQEAINEYGQWFMQTRLRSIDSQEVAVKINALFDSIEQDLKQMDILVEIIRESKPEFYAGYKSARKVLTRRTSALALKAQVTIVGSGEPLVGVTLVFTGVDDETKGEKLEKRTAEKGSCYIKMMVPGDYLVKASRPGYVTQELTISVADAEMYRLNIEMQTNGN